MTGYDQQRYQAGALEQAELRRLAAIPTAELWASLIVGDPMPGKWHCYHVGHLHLGAGTRMGPIARELGRRGLAHLAQRRLADKAKQGFSYLIQLRVVQGATEPAPGRDSPFSETTRRILEAFDRGERVVDIAKSMTLPYHNVYSVLTYHKRLGRHADGAAGRIR